LQKKDAVLPRKRIIGSTRIQGLTMRCSMAVLMAAFVQCTANTGGMRASRPSSGAEVTIEDGDEIDWAMMREEMSKHLDGAEHRQQEEFGIADRDGNGSVDIQV
jgi:hypothetical protein